MRRIWRDTWSWRGGLALDELDYVPVPADATAGPIARPAKTDWPLLVSVVDVVALLGPGAGADVSTSVAALFHLLATRTGGYHARLPRALPDVEREHAVLEREHGFAGYAVALERLEAVGLVDRGSARMTLLRPPSPSPADLRWAREHMDAVARDAARDDVDRQLTRMAWRVERGGVLAMRFRELARFGRLRATVHDDPGHEDQHGLFDVGPTALPPLDRAVNALADELHAVRGWVSAHGARHADGVAPLPLTAYELGALLLGQGVGANAVRRATRASGLWLVLLGHAGDDPEPFDTSVASLATEMAPYLGLAADGDHRATVAALLSELERIGAVVCERPTRKTLRVVVLRPAAPDDGRVRHFLRQWSAWRLAADGDPAVGMGRLLDLSGDQLRRVRSSWAGLLERRRVTVEVLAEGGA